MYVEQSCGVARMSRLVVQHWIACLETQFEFSGAWLHPYNLLGVSYTYTVAADVEFPCEIPRLDLFARFFYGRGTREFEIEVHRTDAPNGPEWVETYGPFTVFFRRDQTARNYVFRLQNFPLPGPGRYQTLLRMVKPRRRRPLAEEFFEVVQTP
jgi:hypothetical protein